MICKAYFEDLRKVALKEEIGVSMCGYEGAGRGNYFMGDTLSESENEPHMPQSALQNDLKIIQLFVNIL